VLTLLRALATLLACKADKPSASADGDSSVADSSGAATGDSSDTALTCESTPFSSGTVLTSSDGELACLLSDLALIDVCLHPEDDGTRCLDFREYLEVTDWIYPGKNATYFDKCDAVSRCRAADGMEYDVIAVCGLDYGREQIYDVSGVLISHQVDYWQYPHCCNGDTLTTVVAFGAFIDVDCREGLVYGYTREDFQTPDSGTTSSSGTGGP
jgi:hypothetical protein